MSLAKHGDGRPAQRWSKPEQPPASRRGREHWVVRWIGAAKRRATKLVETPAITAPSAQVIQLSWIDTCGRPSHVAVLRPAGAIVRFAPLLR